MRSKHMLIALLMMSVTAGCSAAPSPAIGNSALSSTKDAVLSALISALKPTKLVARVYYHGACSTRSIGTAISFPDVVMRHTARGDSGLSAIEAMFAGNGNVVVRESPAGIVRITIGRPSITVLNTKIPFLKLSPNERYNPTLAIMALADSEPVDVAMRRLHLRPVAYLLNVILAWPMKGLPHLPPVLTHTTYDQVLDQIARTFQGIVVYGDCMRTLKARQAKATALWGQIDVNFVHIHSGIYY